MDDACAYFSHDASRGECALLADVREVVKNGDAVSGAAGCEGKGSLSALAPLGQLPGTPLSATDVYRSVR